MSTHAKLAVTAAALMGLGLLVGFFPIYAGAADCGAAFMSRADEFNAYGRDLCGGRVAMLRYPAIVLLVAGGIAGVIALSNYEVDRRPVR